MYSMRERSRYPPRTFASGPSCFGGSLDGGDLEEAAGQYFDPAIYNLRIKRPTAFDAYCQSPRYFSEIEQLLRMELEFKTTRPV